MTLLDHLVAKLPNVKRTTFKRMVLAHRVLINGRVATRLKEELKDADTVEVLDQPRPQKRGKHPAPKPPRAAAAAAKRPQGPQILHEDADVIVVVKPPGLLTSTTAREKRPTLAAMLKEYLAATQPRARLGIIHRLDRDASGLLVFSKHDEAYRALKHQFYHHTVDRVYAAVIEGVPSPKEGTIENFLLELPDGRVVPVRESKKGQRAVTKFKTVRTLRRPPELAEVPEQTRHAGKLDPKLKLSSHLALVEVRLETGRKHQIRAHFAARKTPIMGDVMYGPLPDPPTRLMLAATRLAFEHPGTGERVTFDADPPEEIVALFGEGGGKDEGGRMKNEADHG